MQGFGQVNDRDDGKNWYLLIIGGEFVVIVIHAENPQDVLSVSCGIVLTR